MVVGEERLYLVFPPSSGGDLHSYVRARRRLREGAARQLFRQVVAAVHEVHLKGIVLRDLKLRKFVFTDESRWAESGITVYSFFYLGLSVQISIKIRVQI